MPLNLDYAKFHDEYQARILEEQKESEKRRQEWWAEHYRLAAMAEFEPLNEAEIIF